MKALVLTVLALLLLGAPLSYYAYTSIIHRPLPLAEPVITEIPRGASLNRIASILEEDGVLPSKLPFVLYNRLQRNTLKSGEYLFPAEISLAGVSAILMQGIPYQRSFTVTEGTTYRDILMSVDQNPMLDATLFHQLVMDAVEASALFSTPEGLLFPETYAYSRHSAETQLVQRMSHTTLQLLERYQRPGWSKMDVLILASIIEKEAGNRDEMPLISSVFHNRLERRMRLQADPTVIYGLGDDDALEDRLRRRHLEQDTPYNTYTRHGLPPTPICSPSEAAIASAANPAQTNYLYFVAAPGESGHVFSTTLAEHNRHVQRYWDFIRSQRANQP
ncbi:aminodeoxychorismate lyase [Desulfurispirillum indicum S5]|uniref:Endolytic murein transglycosylase n=1 Tax=Desulfurispirillum indicum (strain ATCC BAA-1389 / DSM 22839 / S5) TaxID=653733 RepID=E6W0B6_DESIS|nr:endolytic transglycosylase MltG [Desulfurispirillum indicum]ADU66334.1 aminodeoxychorismate lyase [Desulfurispirillum indicum S5]